MNSPAPALSPNSSSVQCLRPSLGRLTLTKWGVFNKIQVSCGFGPSPRAQCQNKLQHLALQIYLAGACWHPGDRAPGPHLQRHKLPLCSSQHFSLSTACNNDKMSEPKEAKHPLGSGMKHVHEEEGPEKGSPPVLSCANLRSVWGFYDGKIALEWMGGGTVKDFFPLGVD